MAGTQSMADTKMKTILRKVMPSDTGVWQACHNLLIGKLRFMGNTHSSHSTHFRVKPGFSLCLPSCTGPGLPPVFVLMSSESLLHSSVQSHWSWRLGLLTFGYCFHSNCSFYWNSNSSNSWHCPSVLRGFSSYHLSLAKLGCSSSKLEQFQIHWISKK